MTQQKQVFQIVLLSEKRRRGVITKITKRNTQYVNIQQHNFHFSPNKMSGTIKVRPSVEVNPERTVTTNMKQIHLYILRTYMEDKNKEMCVCDFIANW